MTSANDPSTPGPQASDAHQAESSTAIQATPPGEPGRIPLPPPPAPPKPLSLERLAVELTRLDRVLVLVVLALAFLLSSFAIRNSDFWLHLATGRLIAHGQYSFGADPFSYTTRAYWANHSWLFDLAIYGLTSVAGGIDAPLTGIVLVGAKALLFVALAVVLMRTSRVERSLWAPAVCTALALLATGPRALFNSTCLSFLFFGLTLYLLHRPAQLRAAQTPGRFSHASSYWLLVPLFVLWVNLDSWFFMGPVTVGLYLLGSVLQQTFAPIRTGPDAPDPGEGRTLALVLVLGTAACLLNPHLYHAFALPAELYSPTLQVVHAREARYLALTSLVDLPYYRGDAQSPGGIAFFALVGVSLVSFVLNHHDLRPTRVLLWLGTLALAAYQVRNIPFFAVAAAPIAALNLQDFAGRQIGRAALLDRRWREWSLGGRIVSILVGVLLVVLAWPGWLHGRFDNPRLNRRVGFVLDPDESLRKAAEQVRAWREQTLLEPEDHGFQYTPEVANYFAWFCPGEKSFFDTRYQLFTPVADLYMDIRQALRGSTSLGPDFSGRSSPLTDATWQKAFRDPQYRIHYVVLSSLEDSHLVRRRLLASWEQWALLYADGRTTIFGWRDPVLGKSPEYIRRHRLDPNQLVFGREPFTAPEAGPGRSPKRPDLWDEFVKGPLPRPLTAEEASFYVMEYFPIVADRWVVASVRTAQIVEGGSVAGLAAGAPVSVTAPNALITMMQPPWSQFASLHGVGPPAPLLLGIRAARRALVENPDDLPAILALAPAYRTLWADLEGRWSGSNMQRTLLLRQVQHVATLQQALILRPDAPEIRAFLKEYYFNIRYYDYALESLNEELRLTKAAGRRPNEKPEEFLRRLEELQKVQKEVDATIQRIRNEYELAAANQPLEVKAQMAMQRDLPKRALDLLLQAASLERPEEAELQLLLLLRTGQVDMVKDRLDPNLKAVLGTNYEWFKTLQAAATGNYKEAGEYLDELIAITTRDTAYQAWNLTTSQTFRGILGPSSLHMAGNGVVNMVRSQAGLHVLRGMLALEQGDNVQAAKSFDEALRIGEAAGPSQNGTFVFDGKGLAVRYGSLLRQGGN